MAQIRYEFIIIGICVVGAIVSGMAIMWVWLRRQTAAHNAQLKESFSALSLEALSRNTTDFLKIANETLSRQTQNGEKDLEMKKKLIDQTLDSIRSELEKVQDLVTKSEKDSAQKFSELANQLKMTAEQTGKLHETTSQLKTALVSTSARGQWGQRMAEDILRLAGFIEGVNYEKEKAQNTISTRPDYTFFLPQGLKVNMDVKFPMSNYLRFLECPAESEKQKFREQFLRDVRLRIKEVTSRDYINPEEKTVDYVIVFIPNEQIYSFINEYDRTLLDDALKNKVIFCSPLTLYAVLAVIRQAVDNFNLEKTAAAILSLLGSFNKQWEAFTKSFDKLGNRIDEVRDEYNALTSTRRAQLDRQIKRIEELRKQGGIAESPAVETELLTNDNPGHPAQ